MTELQIGLIGLGAAAVVGVLGYNKWQERQQRKLAEGLVQSKHEDVLLGGGEKPARRAEKQEPVLGGSDDPDVTLPGAVTVEAPEPGESVAVHVPPLEDFDDVADIPAGDVPAALLDPRLEFIVVMELVEAVSGGQIVHSQQDALGRIAKAIHWVGFSDRTREWEYIAPDSQQAYRRLRIGLQLADRRGPLADADLAVFAGAMQNLADELMAVADMPSGRVLDQALELDRFCAEVDLEIGVNLVSQGMPFSGTKIRALAEAAGMALGADGLFTRYDDEGRAQFSLQNLENPLFSPDSIKTVSTHGLTFILDVPRVEHGERVFQQMVELARRFGDTLQGQLVDDNRQPLTDAHLDRIRRDFVMKPQATMAAYGLPAGGPQALRLFA